MRRYIDADELIEFFDGYPDYVGFDVEDIKSIINEQYTADVRKNIKARKVLAGGMSALVVMKQLTYWTLIASIAVLCWNWRTTHEVH